MQEKLFEFISYGREEKRDLWSKRSALREHERRIKPKISTATGIGSSGSYLLLQVFTVADPTQQYTCGSFRSSWGKNV